MHPMQSKNNYTYTSDWYMNVKDMCEAQFYENFKISKRQYEILLAKINYSANIVRSDFKLHLFFVFCFGENNISTHKRKIWLLKIDSSSTY